MRKLNKKIMEELFRAGGDSGGGGYPEPTGNIDINENGSHNVKDYATATVNVPTGGDNPFVPAASEGYTEYKNACTSPWQAVRDGGDFLYDNAYINVTKGLGQEIQVGDKVLFTGTVTNELTYAVWGQVTRTITTAAQYDRIVLGTGHRASFRPYTTKSTEIMGGGEYNAFGLTSIVFKDTGFAFITGAEFASEPELGQSVNVSQFYGVQVDGGVVAHGYYDEKEFIVAGQVTAYDDSAGTGAIDVTDVYPVGTPSVLTTKTITANGQYIAELDDNADGYSEVVVDVPTGGGAEEELAKAANHTLTELNNSLITTVPYYFFPYNIQLTAVNLPNCTTIEQSGFSNCTNLATVNIPKCRTLKSSAFSGCYALTELNLPEVTELGTACPTGERSTLDRLIAPKLPAIGYSSLNNLPKLRLLEILGNNGIAGSNLSGCSLLQVLAIRTTARVCTNQSAGNLTLTQLTTGKVLVPRALLEDYKAHNNWTPCASRFFALEDYTVDGTTTGALDETKIWS